MMGNFWGNWSTGFGGFMPFSGVLFALFVIWSIIWKGVALWKAARDGSKGWFVALLVINTFGILELLYLYVFSKKSEPMQPEHKEHHEHHEHPQHHEHHEHRG